MRCPASSHWPRSSLPCAESIRMPHTKSVILRLHFSSVSRIARLASRQAMFGLTVVVGSSMVTAMRGRSAAGGASGGRAEAATSVPTVRRNSRRCMRELYIGEKAVGIKSSFSLVGRHAFRTGSCLLGSPWIRSELFQEQSCCRAKRKDPKSNPGANEEMLASREINDRVMILKRIDSAFAWNRLSGLVPAKIIHGQPYERPHSDHHIAKHRQQSS